MLHHRTNIRLNSLRWNIHRFKPNQNVPVRVKKKMDTLKEIRDAKRKRDHPDYRLQRHCPHEKYIETDSGQALCRNCGWKLPDY